MRKETKRRVCMCVRLCVCVCICKDIFLKMKEASD